jgi:hypothetical protein
LTNQREANKIGVAMQACATRINAADNIRGYDCGACHNGKMIFDGQTVSRACSKVFEVKKESLDGLPVLFYTRDV